MHFFFPFYPRLPRGNTWASAKLCLTHRVRTGIADWINEYISCVVQYSCFRGLHEATWGKSQRTPGVSTPGAWTVTLRICRLSITCPYNDSWHCILCELSWLETVQLGPWPVVRGVGVGRHQWPASLISNTRLQSLYYRITFGIIVTRQNAHAFWCFYSFYRYISSIYQRIQRISKPSWPTFRCLCSCLFSIRFILFFFTKSFSSLLFVHKTNNAEQVYVTSFWRRESEDRAVGWGWQRVAVLNGHTSYKIAQFIELLRPGSSRGHDLPTCWCADPVSRTEINYEIWNLTNQAYPNQT